MTFTILVTAPKLAAAGMDYLKKAGCRVLLLEGTKDAAEVEQLLASNEVHGVISRTVDLTAKAVAASPHLKVISKHGVGVSNIDVAAASARGIPVFVTPGANAASVAEMTVALMLAAARRVCWMDREIRDGRWSRVQDGLQLSGRTLGLVGFGQIGQRVARVALSLGMKVIAYDPAAPAESPLLGVSLMDSLDSLLLRANVLSLHIPLNAHTRHLIDARTLALLPAGAILINTARGEVVDEAALIDALDSGRLFAAGLDTTAHEPIKADSPLLNLPNVVLTPHVGGSTPSALDAMALGAATHVLGFLQGNQPAERACVNPQVLQQATEPVTS